MLVVTPLAVVLISAASNATSPDDHQCPPDQPSTGGSATDIDDLQSFSGCSHARANIYNAVCRVYTVHMGYNFCYKHPK